MSYAIVRNIKTDKDGTVTVMSTDNNVYPRHYSEWVMSYRNDNNPFTGKIVQAMARK